jgi:hypothetical protein
MTKTARTPAEIAASLRIRVTWELSLQAAQEAAMRAGASPHDESVVQGIIRRSRHATLVRSGAFFGAADELQSAGYRITGMDIVHAAALEGTDR